MFRVLGGLGFSFFVSGDQGLGLFEFRVLGLKGSGFRVLNAPDSTYALSAVGIQSRAYSDKTRLPSYPQTHDSQRHLGFSLGF